MSGGFESLRGQIPKELLDDLDQQVAAGAAVVETTVEKAEVWVNSSSGNDRNGGLSESDAVRTIARAIGIYTRIGPATRYVIIRLDGTFDVTDFEALFLFSCSRPAYDPTCIIISGLAEYENTLDDGSGGEITSTVNAAGKIGFTDAGYEHNQFRGHYCKITSGPMEGERHLVRKSEISGGNVVFTLLENTEVPVGDPGAGAEFHLEAPKTVIDGEGVLGAEIYGAHRFYMQNLRFTGGATFTSKSDQSGGTGEHNYSHIMSTGEGFSPALFDVMECGVIFGGDIWDLSGETPERIEAGDLGEYIGFSQVGYTIGPMLFERSSPGFNFCVIPELHITNGVPNFKGSSVETFYALMCQSGSPHRWTSDVGDSVGSRFGGYVDPDDPLTPLRPAVVLDRSSGWFNRAIFDDSTHGLELLEGSRAVLRECSGSNNSLSGAYVHDHSSVLQFKQFGEGDNTLSGNSGTVEISKDGAAQLGTWAGADIVDIDCIKRDLSFYLGPPL